MSQEVEIYKEAVRIMDEENHRKIVVTREAGDEQHGRFLIEVTQIFRRDLSIPAAKLIASSGFPPFSSIPGALVSEMAHDVTPDISFKVRVSVLAQFSIMLEIEWHFCEPKSLKDGMRALNRAFNMFKSKLEEQ